jgi:hypothetical protein
LIRGSTTIVELMELYPDGRAADLMTQLNWPCRVCGGGYDEPLACAAHRHKNSPKAVLEAFRALDDPGGPSAELIGRARAKVSPRRREIAFRAQRIPVVDSSAPGTALS